MLEKYGKVLLVLCMGAVIALLGLLVQDMTTVAQRTRQTLHNVEIRDVVNGSEEVILYSENVTIPSSISAEFIDRRLAGTAMAGLGAAFKKAEADYGVNALFLTGLAIYESNYGNSAIAQAKNNLFGFMAYDSSPFESAGYFRTKEEGIDHVARYLRNHYLTPGGTYYNGVSISAINVKYASDQEWASKIILRLRRFLAIQ